MIARLLRRLADWLDPPRRVPNVTSLYHDITKALIAEAEARFGAGFGDAKRRDVYAQLMKRFPKAKKRDLAFEIEQVLREE